MHLARASIATLLLFIACNSDDKGGDDPGGSSGASAGKGGRPATSAGGSGGDAGASSAGADGSADGGATAEAPWHAEDLGEGQCLAINASGQVLGLDAEGNTFLIEAEGARSLLGAMPDGARAVGVALAPNGEVVGFSESETGRTAIRYSAGNWEALQGLTASWSVAASIDEDGQIAGTFGTSDGKVHAFLWQDKNLQPLPVSLVRSSSALVRAKGRLAGVAELADGSTRAFVTVDGTGQVSDLGTLGGRNSTPFAMNSRGTVVGAAHDPEQVVGAFVWRPGGALRALGVPSGARATEARGVDSAEHVLGNVIDGSGIARGVFFDTKRDSIRDLPVPKAKAGGSFLAARVVAVAPDGRAVGTGTVTGGSGSPVHCVLWRPL